jgi:hypothetical protein
MSWIRTLGLALLILLLAAGSLIAATSGLSILVRPGVTDVEYSGVSVRIESTDDVMVYLDTLDGEVVGRVEAVPGTDSADVTITVLEDPNRVIFSGRVVAPSWFADYLPCETGRGEQ